MLLDHGANLNVQVGLNGKVAQEAADHGHEDIVRLLYDHGAEASAQGLQSHFLEDRFTDSNVLQIALENDHHTIVKLLVEHGADCKPQIPIHESARFSFSTKRDYSPAVGDQPMY